MVSEAKAGDVLNLQTMVLILVLVEDGLGVAKTWMQASYNWVLILVLVEDGLGVGQFASEDAARECLNPCFSGGWSRRATFGSIYQRDCCNDIFNFVNFWRPKICTFSGVITDANLRIFGECEHVFREYFGVFWGRCRIKKVGT